ncbi:hypothetical protein [Paractinoplanes atraurantiacus]|uniref:Cytochrome P450 n=1 Tax=Paractinoplanes atraurantiacus TaxID=1036182 RepID=A0A285INV0_9ACTN|nr:hypothetical protein [Actinoplanes atraurantiacus]SNY49624.1 hypothetical protein SAMN05421748_11068 [Actinoplanes atraurantiacus]
MREILYDPAYVVPAVPPGSAGVGWLRATVGRFCEGDDHARRRGLAEAILDGIPPGSLKGERGHPVAVLAAAMGVTDPDVASLVEDVAQAYQPGSGDDERADPAVERLVVIFGGRRDEETAARIGVLVQACTATLALIEKARHRPVDEVLRDDPPVPFTKRRRIDSDEVVLVPLAGETAFGAGPRRCPGRAHALALAEAATNHSGAGRRSSPRPGPPSP